MSARPNVIRQIDDRLARSLGIPVFGLLIPHFVGLFGPLTMRDGAFWWGTVAFVGLAFVIWQGNRWLLFKQREQLNWFDRPIYKIIALVFACTFYTAPVTVLWIAAWYELSGVPSDADALRAVALINVICVLFVTHAYETVFLIKGRTEDSARLADMERAVTQAQLDALRQQVDPHFLFNSLNTLAALIESDPSRAARFNAALAEVYRYLLDDRPLVELGEELEFVRAYSLLLSLRFGDALKVSLPAEASITAFVPPTAVQCLIENAVKHTRFNQAEPLHVTVLEANDTIEVSNPMRPKDLPRPSAGVGLKNLDERCRLLLHRGLDVESDSQEFTVRVPLGGQAL